MLSVYHKFCLISIFSSFIFSLDQQDQGDSKSIDMENKINMENNKEDQDDVAEQDINSNAQTYNKCNCNCFKRPSPEIICKALTYRIFAMLGTAGSAYFISGDVGQAFKIASISSGISTILYLTYDIIWARCCHRRCKNCSYSCC